MFSIEDFFNLAGSLICHQLPSRTIYSGNTPLPVCARDTGIYTGIFIGMLYILLMRRLRAQKPPDTASAVFMCLLMLPMILDGLLSYTGLTGTNNTVRLFTGVLFGLPIPFFLVPAAHFDISGANTRKVLNKTVELIPVYAFAIILCMLVLKGYVPYVISGIIYITGLIFLLSRLSYTVLARVWRFKSNGLYIATFGATVSVLAFLYLLSAFILQPIKSVLLGR